MWSLLVIFYCLQLRSPLKCIFVNVVAPRKFHLLLLLLLSACLCKSVGMCFAGGLFCSDLRMVISLESSNGHYEWLPPLV